MIHFHDGSFYRNRACMAWGEMQPVDDIFDRANDLAAGYCLDAIEEQPAGATWRVEPDSGEPFAAPRSAYGRY
jgi:hypothetical protein